MSIQVEWIDWTEPNQRAEIRRQWDELYERSTVRQPTSRFEHVELWFDCFAPRAKREALVVEENGRWLAVAPLIRTWLNGFLPTWEIPYSFWTPSPEILIDAEQHRDPALIGSLLHGMMRNGRWLVRANELLGDSSVVQQLEGVISKSDYEHDWNTRYEIGKVPIHGAGAPVDWADFQRQLSGNFRRQMRKMVNRAEREGGVEMQVIRPTSGQEAEPWVRAGFELEHRGWKGQNQTSVLSHPEKAEFFYRQAGLLAARNKLILVNLLYQGELIAFEYGFRFKRTYFSPKIAYDENHARLSPGHLLMHLWIERMYSEDEFDCYDFTGPITEATAKWAFSTYPVKRLVAGTGWKGQQVIKAARLAKQAKSKIEGWRQRLRPANKENPVGVPAEANL
jgi:CelD/BcsL family acetyltransferase involved in cellulose biosynthesis